MEKIKLNEIKKIYEDKYIVLNNASYSKKSGLEGNWAYVERKNDTKVSNI